ncbi:MULTISPECIES: NADPH:quinone reductase [Roseobacteraceae]|uniref:NADPH:quinone reductase n=1 Tax=Roseobacteraceae TaxID=2854170 RepID=UPI003296DA2D
MRAAVYTQTGPAEDALHLIDLPDPVLAAGEVLVRVHVSGINPADVKRRAGWNGMQMVHPQAIPHCDGAGVIEATGDGVDPSRIDSSRIGTRVRFSNAQGGYGEAGRACGTAAELITLPSAQAVDLPYTFDFASGACLGVPGLTVWLLVLSDGPVAGNTVHIQGAAGAVGNMALQIAVHEGARVIAIAIVSSDAGAAHVAACADVPSLNRHMQDIAAEVETLTKSNGAYRIIEVDLAANLEIDIACFAPHRTVASYSSSSDPTPMLPYCTLANLGAAARFVQDFRLTPAQWHAAETTLTKLATNGALRPAVTAEFQLDDIAQAHTRVAQGALGQTVLNLMLRD